MSVMTHESKWRLLAGAAPVVGVAFFVWSAAQDGAGMAGSPAARALLAIVAALGMAVAWWTARQLRASPTLTVSRAGELAHSARSTVDVALSGRARALPDAVPLVSPDGELCLWFRDGGPSGHDSVRPFLLVDDSGQCIVLPAGADFTGHGPVPASAACSARAGPPGRRRPRASERLLRNGDRILVTGRFVPASPASLSLPVMVAGQPGEGQGLVVRIGADDDGGGVYGLLAVVDCVVLVVASSLVAWSVFTPG